MSSSSKIAESSIEWTTIWTSWTQKDWITDFQVMRKIVKLIFSESNVWSWHLSFDYPRWRKKWTIFKNDDWSTEHCSYCCKFSSTTTTNKTRASTSIWKKMNGESQRSSYQSELRIQIEQTPDNNDLNIDWRNLKQAFLQKASNTVGYTHRARQPWIANFTFELIEQRIKATKCGKNTKYLCRETKRAVKNDKELFWRTKQRKYV